MDLFRHLTGVSKSAGFDLAMITPSEMEDMHPYYQALADKQGGVIGGIHDPYEGDIDPSQLTQALANNPFLRPLKRLQQNLCSGLFILTLPFKHTPNNRALCVTKTLFSFWPGGSLFRTAPLNPANVTYSVIGLWKHLW